MLEGTYIFDEEFKYHVCNSNYAFELRKAPVRIMGTK